MRVELRVDHNAMNTSTVEVEIIITEVIDVPLNTFAGRFIADIVVAADTDERDRWV